MREFKNFTMDHKKDLDLWKDSLLSYVLQFNIVKMSIHPKLINNFNVMPTKIPARVFSGT